MPSPLSRSTIHVMSNLRKKAEQDRRQKAEPLPSLSISLCCLSNYQERLDNELGLRQPPDFGSALTEHRGED